MDSTQLSQFRYKFSDWHPLDERGIQNAPNQQGTYVIRKGGGQRFNRLQGETDIMYIGSATGKGGLKTRLRWYLHPGSRQPTNLRIHQMITKYSLEVAWCPNDEPENFEYRLLNQYDQDHDELPPLNRAGRRSIRITDKSVGTEVEHLEK